MVLSGVHFPSDCLPNVPESFKLLRSATPYPFRNYGRSMRLATFIRANVQAIAADWERFAATLQPEETLNSAMLRNDIVDMLADIADNLEQEQSADEQRKKSEGEPGRSHYTEGAIVQHVVSRISMGLSPRQFLSEFRALRATVIRLWQHEVNEIDSVALADMIRFNEAIDQVLAEGTVNYSREIDRSRELFLSILGHDLRNPLSAISGLAELLMRAKTPERHGQFASQILVSAQRMSHIVSDLLELARVRLGSGIIIHRTAISMRHVCANVIGEMQAAFPHRVLRLNAEDELLGEWDENRLGQVVSNLVSNAIQHGAENAPVTVTVQSGDSEIEVSVHDEGSPIPADMIPKLFDSFYRLDERNAGAHRMGLGLGLYISKEIIAAHGGTIEVRSSVDEGTTFIVHLPQA